MLQQQRENEQIKLQLTEEQAMAEQARRRADDAHRKAEEASKQAEAASQSAREANLQADAARKNAEAERILAETAQQQLELEKKKNLPLYKRKGFWVITSLGLVALLAASLTGGLVYERINQSDLGTITYTPSK